MKLFFFGNKNNSINVFIDTTLHLLIYNLKYDEYFNQIYFEKQNVYKINEIVRFFENIIYP